MSDGSEFVCEKCEGTGCYRSITSDVTDPRFLRCPQCQGEGKLDWIENIVGKKKEKLRSLVAEWSISSTRKLEHLYDSDLEKEIKDVLAEEIARKVDKDIMKALGIFEKILKPPREAKTVVISIKKQKMGG